MIHFIGNDSIDSQYQKSTVSKVIEYFTEKKSIALDTETQGFDPHTKKMLCLQLGNSENQFVIDVRTIDILQFKELIESKLIIAHNIKFDYKFLKHAGIIVDKIWDTQLAECCLLNGKEFIGKEKKETYNLKALVLKYENKILDKDTRGDFYKLTSEPFTEKQIEYAALDVAYLHNIANKQWEAGKSLNLLYAMELENKAVKGLADIEYNGLLLDTEAWKKNIINVDSEIIEVEKQLDTCLYSEEKCRGQLELNNQQNLFDFNERLLFINYASPKQIKGIFELLGYRDLDTTGDRELKKLKGKHLFFDLLDKHRELSKLSSTYGESFIKTVNKTTGRTHTSFWQVLDTYRVSSGSRKDKTINVQNIPKENNYRNCFLAKSGFKWVSIDFSGQEFRLVVDAAKEDRFIEILEKGEDLHCFAGTLMFGKPITKDNFKERFAAKTINFGVIYGMGPNKLADTLQIPLDQATELLKKYSESFPSLTKYLMDQAKSAKINGFARIRPPHNGIRWIDSINKAKEARNSSNPDWKFILSTEGLAERIGKNMPIQGAGAAIFKESLVACRDLVISYNKNYNEEVAILQIPVHDELNFEVRADLAEQFAKEAGELMKEYGNKYVTHVSMEVDTTITDFWTK